MHKRVDQTREEDRQGRVESQDEPGGEQHVGVVVQVEEGDLAELPPEDEEDGVEELRDLDHVVNVEVGELEWRKLIRQ